MKSGLVLIILGVIVSISFLSFVLWNAHSSEVRMKSDCEVKENDPDQYLYKICKHLQAMGMYPADQPDYEIEYVSEGTFQNRSVYIIALSCCYTGDTAYIDKESGEVIRIRPGAE
jgi:hypothetical protein